MTKNLVKYFFLGDVNKKEKIGEISFIKNSKISETSLQLLKQYSSNIQNTDNNNNFNKIITEEGIIYNKILNDTFYLGLLAEEYPNVLNLFEEIKEENIHLLINQKGQLNDIGKTTLNDKIIYYNNNPKKRERISSINDEINDIQIEMKESVKKAINNNEDITSLDEKAVKIKDNANLFKKDAEQITPKTFFKKYKWNLIMGFLLIGILLLIFIPLFN